MAGQIPPGRPEAVIQDGPNTQPRASQSAPTLSLQGAVGHETPPPTEWHHQSLDAILVLIYEGIVAGQADDPARVQFFVAGRMEPEYPQQ